MTTETELTPELRDTLLREDAAIDRAAKTAAWDSRPAELGMSAGEWWVIQGTVRQRLWRRRARVIIESWENDRG